MTLAQGYVERATRDGRTRRFALAEPRACKECGSIFRPRQRDVNAGAGIYCSPQCARVGTGKEARKGLKEEAAAFWSRVDRSGGPEACWEWRGYRDARGYGRARLNRRSQWAHRVAYTLTHGPLAERDFVCHRCDNTPCCNPGHLFKGSVADNNADMVRKNRNACGERSGQARLTREQVLAIRADDRAGRIVAAAYGVSASLVSMVRKRRLWRHLG